MTLYPPPPTIRVHRPGAVIQDPEQHQPVFDFELRTNFGDRGVDLEVPLPAHVIVHARTKNSSHPFSFQGRKELTQPEIDKLNFGALHLDIKATQSTEEIENSDMEGVEGADQEWVNEHPLGPDTIVLSIRGSVTAYDKVDKSDHSIPFSHGLTVDRATLQRLTEISASH